MARIELKNDAAFGDKVPCVMLTVSQTNPLSDDELIEHTSQSFSDVFGDVPWWVGVCRKPVISEDITVVLQKAPQNFRRINDPKFIYFNRLAPVNKVLIDEALRTSSTHYVTPKRRVVPVIEIVVEPHELDIHESAEYPVGSLEKIEVPGTQPEMVKAFPLPLFQNTMLDLGVVAFMEEFS